LPEEPRRGDGQPVGVKIDPRSKTTGIAIITAEAGNKPEVLYLFELAHRGRQISEAVTGSPGVSAASPRCESAPRCPTRLLHAQQVRSRL
jgi:hypothetical protein